MSWVQPAFLSLPGLALRFKWRADYAGGTQRARGCTSLCWAQGRSQPHSVNGQPRCSQCAHGRRQTAWRTCHEKHRHGSSGTGRGGNGRSRGTRSSGRKDRGPLANPYACSACSLSPTPSSRRGDAAGSGLRLPRGAAARVLACVAAPVAVAVAVALPHQSREGGGGVGE